MEYFPTNPFILSEVHLGHLIYIFDCVCAIPKMAGNFSAIAIGALNYCHFFGFFKTVISKLVVVCGIIPRN